MANIDVPARVRVGFETDPGDAYNTTFSQQDRQDFKVAVWTEITTRIPLVNRDTWNSQVISVPAGDRHLEESAIETWLNEHLASLTGDAGPSGFQLPQGGLVRVRYNHWDNVRECEHCHALNYAGNPWQITENGYTAQLFIQLAWDTPV